MWYHTDGCAKQYHSASAIYPLSFLDLEFFIIIDIEVGSPGHGTDVVGVLYDRDKYMLKLAMAKLINPEIIRDDPIFPSA